MADSKISGSGLQRPSASNPAAKSRTPSKTTPVKAAPAPVRVERAVKAAAATKAPEAAPQAALAVPGLRRKMSKPGSPDKQASVIAFPDGEEAVMLPTFARGAYAKVSSAAAAEDPEEPQVVRKQRTYERVAHDAAKIAKRLRTAREQKLITSEEEHALRADWKVLDGMFKRLRRLNAPEMKAIEKDPQRMDGLVKTGRLTADEAVALRVDHTARLAARIGKTTKAAREGLERMPRIDLTATQKSRQEICDIVYRALEERVKTLKGWVKNGSMTQGQAALLKVNAAELDALVASGALTAEHRNCAVSGPEYVVALFGSGILTADQATRVLDVTAPIQNQLVHMDRRLAALDTLRIKTNYREPREAAQERRILKRVDSPLAPRNVAVVNGMEYELVKRFDGDAQTLFAQDLPAPERAALVRAMAVNLVEGLAVAHRNGVAHLDLKPANILLDTRAGKFVVGDWGLAQELQESKDLHGARGTAPFMPPEMYVAHRYREHADVYSLGATLWVASVGSYALRAHKDRPAVEERATLQGLLESCEQSAPDGSRQVDLALLSPREGRAEEIRGLLAQWHALDPEMANLAATAMLRFVPVERWSMDDLLPKLRAMLRPEDEALATQALLKRAPAAQPLDASLVAETLNNSKA